MPHAIRKLHYGFQMLVISVVFMLPGNILVNSPMCFSFPVTSYYPLVFSVQARLGSVYYFIERLGQWGSREGDLRVPKPCRSGDTINICGGTVMISCVLSTLDKQYLSTWSTELALPLISKDGAMETSGEFWRMQHFRILYMPYSCSTLKNTTLS